ncbi:hypothetical protein K438DRAFT_1793539 [Mycena galopus ATCC 62051]|nr:hypothetical protein K438DRAFT_1793539 [Mycena galopus ATCC 62051]
MESSALLRAEVDQADVQVQIFNLKVVWFRWCFEFDPDGFQRASLQQRIVGPFQTVEPRYYKCVPPFRSPEARFISGRPSRSPLVFSGKRLNIFREHLEWYTWGDIIHQRSGDAKPGFANKKVGGGGFRIGRKRGDTAVVAEQLIRHLQRFLGPMSPFASSRRDNVSRGRSDNRCHFRDELAIFGHYSSQLFNPESKETWWTYNSVRFRVDLGQILRPVGPFIGSPDTATVN